MFCLFVVLVFLVFICDFLCYFFNCLVGFGSRLFGSGSRRFLRLEVSFGKYGVGGVVFVDVDSW